MIGPCTTWRLTAAVAAMPERCAARKQYIHEERASAASHFSHDRTAEREDVCPSNGPAPSFSPRRTVRVRRACPPWSCSWKPDGARRAPDR